MSQVYSYDTKQGGKDITKWKTIAKDGTPSPAFDHKAHAETWEINKNAEIDAKIEKDKYESLSKIGKDEFNKTNPHTTFQAG